MESRGQDGKGAFAVANSPGKTAIYGNDANWGRIMAALDIQYEGQGRID